MAERRSIFDELNSMFSATDLDGRGENAWGVAVKFLTLLTEQIPEEDARKKLMSAWMKSVKENNYKKFRLALKRYERQKNE